MSGEVSGAPVATENGYVVGDPCEAIEAVFVYGPQRCMARSVSIAIDKTWGTSHVVCAEHAIEAAS